MESNTMDMLYIRCKPKWKWFKPPFSIKIWKFQISMMWAYNVEKAMMLKNCYPSAMSTSVDNGQKTFTLEWTCEPDHLEKEKN